MLSVLDETVTTKENIMSAFRIDTQSEENYGAHNWDGTGDCPQYWKFKGGNSYIMIDFATEADAEAYAEKNFTHDNDYYKEYVLGIAPCSAEELTSDEECELEYEGCIDYPSLRCTPSGKSYCVPVQAVWDHLKNLKEKDYQHGYDAAKMGNTLTEGETPEFTKGFKDAIADSLELQYA